MYILLRFRKWQFSLGAVAAVFHDVIIVLSIFSVFYGILPFSLEIDQAFIAAIYLDFNNDKHGFLSSFMSGAGYQVAELFLINLIEDESSQLDITTFILDDRNYKNKIVKLIKRIHKYNPTFKVSKSDVSRTGEQIITVQLINTNTKEVISEGKGQNNKKAEQDASKIALIKMGYFKN